MINECNIYGHKGQSNLIIRQISFPLRKNIDMSTTKQANPIKRGEELEITISKMAFGGKGLGKVHTEKGELVVFVPNTIPGQRVKCRVVKSRKNHVETKLLEVLEKSPDEISIPYQPIAGAPYATLPIEIQEKYKVDTCIDIFKRIGGVQNAEELFDTFIASPSHWHYRNKMEYSFAAIRYDLETGNELDEFALGFKHRGTWWMVENLDADSGLFDAEVENNIHLIRKFCEDSGLPPWHAPKRQGFFRFLTVRKSYAENKVLFNLVTTSHDLSKFDMKGFVNLMEKLFGDRLAGIQHTINDDMGDRVQPLDGSTELLIGKDHITENLLGLDFDIRMESFFQTNPKSAELLYNKTILYLKEKVKTDGLIFDLFCGTGTISQLVARDMPNANVVGVEIEKTAVEDAQKSAKANGISNTKFFAADVNRFLYEHPQYAGKIDAVIIDPPRAGIAPKALKRTIGLHAPIIVYISCNPATLARDTNTLNQEGYKLIKYSIVDQFPHTSHVEAVALFEKTS